MIAPAIWARFRRKLRDGTASPLTLAQIQSAIEAGWAGGDVVRERAPVAIDWAFLERLRRPD
ncbi:MULTISPECIES: hypothetical protein [Pseudomonadota]|uniref:hypothetical protein n=1 Tax=Pseudomonadota TaxID=1224 RepID=UPI000769F3CD|nr:MULTISPECIES: hypothetical protein [Pseudomonadota]